MTNQEYISLHHKADTRELALKRAPDGVDQKYCLEQIKSAQRAASKLPAWATMEGLEFPPTISMEQCSSEATALYKQQLVRRLLPTGRQRLVDLTGGFGVDFAHLAPLFHEAVYVETQERLCQIARHNMPLLGLDKAEIRQMDAATFLQETTNEASLIYLDPARRDKNGHRTVMLEDCMPSVPALLPLLKRRTHMLLLKLSPMLHIQQALHLLGGASEVHVVSVDGECRELLLALHMDSTPATPAYCCADTARPTHTVRVEAGEELHAPVLAERLADYLYEPCAAVLKAGIQDVLCQRMGVKKLHPCSHLFTSTHLVSHFPGRAFRVVACHDFSKQSLKQLRQQVRQANIAVRNFPATPDELRHRLRLKDGGQAYLFATTLADGRHTIVRCEKV